ncbi:hypothetical protein SORDD05_01711 [Streptococcus oralis]|uniref:RiboL-PSP-HEPN domain-containing protein n=1 Tax=Streptococcus oralis TaxID=1303 RepID=A0A139M6D0_STROR|nr:HEPN domain-containing protein [Streptococcus oralis]KXT59194.1 hypothetical protein SORDD05_01711 [Streptococcus oralis]
MDSFVQENIFYQNIAKFDDIISNVEISEKRFIENILKENFIITLYTVWESNIKSILFNHLTTYADTIFTDEFVKMFYRTILSSTNYVKDRYLESLTENEIKITKEYYLSTNNLWFDTLIELIQRIYPEASKEELLKFQKLNTKIQNCIDNLESSSVGKFSEKNPNPNALEGYIDSLVNNRNSLAHSGLCSESVNIDDMEKFFDFIDNVLILVKMYLKNLYIQRTVDNDKYVKFSNVLREPIDARSIVEITFDSEQVKFINDKNALSSEWYVKHDELVYPVQICTICNEQEESIQELPDNGHVTLEVWSEYINIRRNRDFQILNLTCFKKDNIEGTSRSLAFKF